MCGAELGPHAAAAALGAELAAEIAERLLGDPADVVRRDRGNIDPAGGELLNDQEVGHVGTDWFQCVSVW